VVNVSDDMCTTSSESGVTCRCLAPLLQFKNDEEFTSNIQNNTPRYVRHFEDVVDELLPQSTLDSAHGGDIFDFLQVSRLLQPTIVQQVSRLAAAFLGTTSGSTAAPRRPGQYAHPGRHPAQPGATLRSGHHPSFRGEGSEVERDQGRR
jgi:hypothetical protein